MKINFPKKKFYMKANLLLNQKINNNNINICIIKKVKIINLFLLDGPPFANGEIHLGHVFNKLIKTVYIRYIFFFNFLILTNLGWDTHGLPIEQKLLIKKKNHFNYRNFVCNIIKNQKKDFFKLNLFNNYYNYNTMEPRYESYQIKFFQYLFFNNIVDFTHQPIYWCNKCNSSLSYSEILYKKIEINSIYFRLKVNEYYILIWTTSIWSLINNQTCFYIKKEVYVGYKSNKSVLIFIKYIYKKIIKRIKLKGKIVFFLYNKYFLKNKYIFFFHKMLKYFNKKNIFLNNIFIDINIGTGLIHCAPSNGIEDYELFKNKNKIYNFINEKFFLYYTKIFKNVNIYFLNKLLFFYLKKKKNLIKIFKIKHKHMFCWRHKKMIIYYLNKQVFINLNFKFKHIKLKQLILFKVNKIIFFPKKLKKMIKKMILLRQNWCISRQRNWGIDLLYTKEKYYYSFLKNIVKNFSSQIICNIYNSNNVFDVWIDSSISSIIFNNNKVIIEGKDQIRGWFQSCIIVNFIFLFKVNIFMIISHNFCIDVNNKKLSKSSNNYVSLNFLCKNYSIDIFTFFFLSHNIFKNIIFNDLKIKKLSSTYKLIRNFLKFIVNNFYGFNFLNKQILIIDIWIIKKIKKFFFLINLNFIKFNFYKSISILIFFLKFLSNFYFCYLKNIIYLYKINSYIRYSSLYTLYNILLFINKTLFSILDFTFSDLKNHLEIKCNKNFNVKIIFSKIIKVKKKINNCYIYSCKLKFFYKFIKYFDNVIINNKFWNWYFLKLCFYFFKKNFFCFFSKNFVKKKKFIILKKICVDCYINKYHNFEKIRIN